MKRIPTLLLLLLFLGSCATKKRTTSAEGHRVSVAASPEKPNEDPSVAEPAATENLSPPSKVNSIISTALTYSGVRYKYGGTTKKGMDCSGLLYVAFKKNDIELPRVSTAMANQGKRIRVDQIQKGDLIFFKTSKRGKKINHVGLVVAVEHDDVKFIHASTSRGVIVSSLREGFWNYAFVKANRIL